MRHPTGGKKKQQTGDWEPAEVVAGVRLAGTSLRQLSLDNDYNEHALKDVLRRHWPKGEQIVAAVLGYTPEEIWPSRYKNKTKKVRFQVDVRRSPA